MQLTASAAEKLIDELGVKGMPLTQVSPTPHHVPSDWFIKYKELCRHFMMSLTDSVETLSFMNLDQDTFINLIMGRALPENLSIRFRIPLIWGGELEIDNLFMCKTFPHSYNMDRFIISQAGNDNIWLPAPTSKIYLPANTLGGGEGGNGTEDRLTEQVASQIAAARNL